MSARFRSVDSWEADRQNAAPHRPQPMIVNQPSIPTTTSSLGPDAPIGAIGCTLGHRP